MNEINSVEKIFLSKNEEDVKELSKSVNKKEKKKYGKAPTKEKLEECVVQKMNNIEIGKLFDITPQYVSVLKKKYGINKRK